MIASAARVHRKQGTRERSVRGTPKQLSRPLPAGDPDAAENLVAGRPERWNNRIR